MSFQRSHEHVSVYVCELTAPIVWGDDRFEAAMLYKPVDVVGTRSDVPAAMIC